MALFIDSLVCNTRSIRIGGCKMDVIARPVLAPFIVRVKDAWLVFVGKADAVKFHEQ